MLQKHHLQPKSICDVGCGAGGVLTILQQHNVAESCVFGGCDISPQAVEMCEHRGNEKVRFKLADPSQEEGAFFDVCLCSMSLSTCLTTMASRGIESTFPSMCP